MTFPSSSVTRQLPVDGTADTRVVPAGRVSLTVVLGAVAGPLLADGQPVDHVGAGDHRFADQRLVDRGVRNDLDLDAWRSRCCSPGPDRRCCC